MSITVLESVILGSGRGFVLHRKCAGRGANLSVLSASTPWTSPLHDTVVGELPVGLRQRVEIPKDLCRGEEILILEEPTSALTPQEAAHLFRMPGLLEEQGKNVT